MKEVWTNAEGMAEALSLLRAGLPVVGTLSLLQTTGCGESKGNTISDL